MAVKYFKGKKITYWISENQKNINKTYRSELVWYSYWKAGVTYKIPASLKKRGIILPLFPCPALLTDHYILFDYKYN